MLETVVIVVHLLVALGVVGLVLVQQGTRGKAREPGARVQEIHAHAELAGAPAQHMGFAPATG